MKKYALRLVALAAAAPLALSACGGSTPTDTKTTPTVSSTASTPSTPSSASSTTESTPSDSTTTSSGGQASGEEVNKDEFIDSMTNAMKDKKTYHLTMDMSASGQAITGEGDVDMSDMNNPKMSLTMKAMGMDMKMVMLDKVSYMNLGTLSGNKWVKMDQASLAKKGGVDTSQLNPAESLEKSKAAITKVVFLGEDSGLKHYQMTMDPTKITGATAAGTGPLTYDVWVDGDNLMNKMEMKLSAAGTAGTIKMATSKWGEPVTIEAPPTSQITTMAGIG